MMEEKRFFEGHPSSNKKEPLIPAPIEENFYGDIWL